MLREVTASEERVRVETFSGLTVEFARSRNATVILRGLRAVSDFEYEFQMALMNKHLAEEIEILFMAPDTTYSFLSSSLVREVARLGGDVTPFVSPSVARRLAERFGGSGG
jgi:pantetheine-phosphate adenylyltransferase